MSRGESDDLHLVPEGRRSQLAKTHEISAEMREAGYEHSDASAAGIVKASAGLLAALVFSLPLVALALVAALRVAGPSVTPPPAPVVRGRPFIQDDQRAQRFALEREAEQKLSTSAWVDQAHRIARIPINDAMALLAAHGWPDDDVPDEALPTGAGRGTPR
jgi:hypothetical protein